MVYGLPDPSKFKQTLSFRAVATVQNMLRITLPSGHLIITLSLLDSFLYTLLDDGWIEVGTLLDSIIYPMRCPIR